MTYVFPLGLTFELLTPLTLSSYASCDEVNDPSMNDADLHYIRFHMFQHTIFTQPAMRRKPLVQPLNSAMCFSCPNCQRGFEKKSNLKRHLQSSGACPHRLKIGIQNQDFNLEFDDSFEHHYDASDVPAMGANESKDQIAEMDNDAEEWQIQSQSLEGEHSEGEMNSINEFESQLEVAGDMDTDGEQGDDWEAEQGDEGDTKSDESNSDCEAGYDSEEEEEDESGENEIETLADLDQHFTRDSTVSTKLQKMTSTRFLARSRYIENIDNDRCQTINMCV